MPGPYQARAAKVATASIPIFFLGLGIDPVEEGFVVSLARPGTNVTGRINLSADLIGKRLELLKECVSRFTRVAMLVNPDWRPSLYQPFVTSAKADAGRLELPLQVVPA